MNGSGEEGYSVVEIVIGIALALILLFAALAVLERAFRVNSELAERVDATQRGRQAMDLMTRPLRSAVCPDPFTASLIGGTDTQVSFFADLSDGSQPPAIHTLVFDPVHQTISDVRSNGTGMQPNTTWPSTPTSVHVLLSDVVATAGVPVFRFNAFDSATPPRPTVVLATPLSAGDVPTASRITISFTVRPTGRKQTTGLATNMQDEIDLRSADPNQPRPAPQCT
ncbi:MAG: hypothetical protein QOD83_2461 [Solirubrobacteraceae bacterium]|nr:hypothetical protein [Solirubrobacteraceae bacterium]